MTRRNLLDGFLWQLSSSWGTRIGTLLVFIVLARLLSPAVLGAVSYVLGVLAVVLVLADFAMAEYLVYRQEAEPEYSSAIWWVQVGGSAVLATAMSMLAWLAPSLVLPADVDPMVLLAASWTMPLLAAGKVPEALLRREGTGFRTLAVRSFAVMLAGALVALPLAWSGGGVWSLIAKQWAEAAVGLALYFQPGAWRPSREWSWGHVRTVMRRSWGLMAGRLLDLAAQRLDVVLIGSLIGLHELGLYSVAQKLFQVLQGTLIGSVYTVINSRLGALRDRATEFRQFFKLAITAAAIVSSSVYLFALALAGSLVEAFFGFKWGSSVPLLNVFLGGALIGSLGQVFLAPYVSLVLQDNRWVMFLFTLDALLTALFLGLAARHGIEAVAIAGVLKTLIMGAAWWLRAQAHLALRPWEWIFALWPAQVLIGIAFASWQLWSRFAPTDWPSWLAVVALASAYAVGWFTLFVLFKPYLRELKAEINKSALPSHADARA